jgi:hypothetical protein
VERLTGFITIVLVERLHLWYPSRTILGLKEKRGSMSMIWAWLAGQCSLAPDEVGTIVVVVGLVAWNGHVALCSFSHDVNFPASHCHDLALKANSDIFWNWCSWQCLPEYFRVPRLYRWTVNFKILASKVLDLPLVPRQWVGNCVPDMLVHLASGIHQDVSPMLTGTAVRLRACN